MNDIAERINIDLSDPMMKYYVSWVTMHVSKGRSRDFEKEWRSMSATMVDRKRILGFRWSEKAKITFELYVFGKIFLSAFSNFLKKNNKQKKKQKKNTHRKVGLCFTTGCFIKSFNNISNHFFVFSAHSEPNFCFLVSLWRKKYQKGK